MLIIALLLFVFIFVQPIYAIYDPLSVPNNRYGIHIVNFADIPELPALVNSSGGDWGYVTMVLSDNDRDLGRWQTMFDQMRRAHLIPIVRLATHVENGSWVIPQRDRFYEIVKLINDLVWPTANRYVVLYNEPNHAAEWGGAVDPEGYAATFVQFAKELKAANSDFFILPAGLDASSVDDEGDYIRRMVAARPEMLTLMDGWTSHSYPNPAFSGSPYARGRGTLSTFDWELSLLGSLGLSKPLPVFITETGWEQGALTADQIAANFVTAAQSIWTDTRIAAITPFIYNYPDAPFANFSWKMKDGVSLFPQYTTYQGITKPAGQPIQHESYTLLSDIVPAKLVTGSIYALSASVENTGQGILSEDDGYTLTVTTGDKPLATFIDPLPYVEPKERGQLMIHVKTPPTPGPLPITVRLSHHGRDILLQQRTVELVPPPSVEVRASLGWRRSSNATNVSLLVYDKDTVIQKFTGLTMKNGVVTGERLINIVPGLPYRVVILVPGYLPRQVIGALNANTTVIYPSRFLPLDFNGDGTFTVADIESLVSQSPWRAIRRFFGP